MGVPENIDMQSVRTRRTFPRHSPYARFKKLCNRRCILSASAGVTTIRREAFKTMKSIGCNNALRKECNVVNADTVPALTNGGNEKLRSMGIKSKADDMTVTRFEAPYENDYYDQLLQYGCQFSDSHSDDDDDGISFSTLRNNRNGNSCMGQDDDEIVSTTTTKDPLSFSYSDLDASFTSDYDKPFSGASKTTSSKVTSESSSDASSQHEDIQLPTYQEEDSFIAACKNPGFFQLNSHGTFLLIMKHPSAVPILGRVNVRCVWGQSKVYGYILKPEITEFLPVCSVGALGQMIMRTIGSPKCGDLQSIRNVLLAQTGNKAVINKILQSYLPTTVAVMFQRLSAPLYAYLRRTHKTIFIKPPHISYIKNTGDTTQYHFTLEMRASNGVKWDVSREQILNDIRDFIPNSASPPKIIVCGGSNVGKSTFCRHFVNSLLNTCPKVSWLDLDPGQSEFTPHGLISVVEVDEPLLGPAFSHQRPAKRMYFVGGTSVADSPAHYMECVTNLFEFWSLDSDLSQQPLFVNTMGWRRGLGVKLLSEVIRLIRPTHVVQISMPVRPSRNMPSMTPQFVAENDCSSICRQQSVAEDRPLANFDYRHYDIVSLVNVQAGTLKAFFLRDVAMVAYFSHLHRNGAFLPLNECHCYSIPWSAVALHACNQYVPKSEILYVINANVVALCECRPDEILCLRDETLPKFLKETPVGECFGYGIVRAVSMEKKCLYVITPVEPRYLRRVNVLLTGSGVHVPVALLKRQTISTHLPYLTVHMRTMPSAITNRHVEPRKFKKRKKRIA